MPFIDINLRQGSNSSERKEEISDGIHQAMIDVLGVPEDDMIHTFHEVPSENMRQSPVAFDIPRGEGSIFVTLSFNARPPEPKERLFEAIVENLEVAGIPKEDIFMRIIETAPENWWIAGREIDPATGFDVRMEVPRESE